MRGAEIDFSRLASRAQGACVGARKAKKQAFLAAHPICYLCGTVSSTTEDHVPARICFKDKVWPEGYVFPVCADCNARDRDSELVVAFHLHSMSDNIEDFARAYSGLKNNYPSALPNPFMTLGEKAKALSSRGMTVPAQQLWQAPIVKLSPDSHQHFHRFGRKLAKALYYKVVGCPAPPDFRIVTHWLVADSPESNNTLESIISIMPTLEIGRRGNVDLGDQFAYRYNASAEGDVMVQTSNFIDKVFITSLGAREGLGLDFDRFLTLPSWRETG
jgi:hypothetical protein